MSTYQTVVKVAFAELRTVCLDWLPALALLCFRFSICCLERLLVSEAKSESITRPKLAHRKRRTFYDYQCCATACSGRASLPLRRTHASALSKVSIALDEHCIRH